MALAMWTAEGVALIVVTTVFIGLFSEDPTTLTMLILAAVFKFATAAYLAQKKIRQGFVPAEQIRSTGSDKTLQPKDTQGKEENKANPQHKISDPS